MRKCINRGREGGRRKRGEREEESVCGNNILYHPTLAIRVGDNTCDSCLCDPPCFPAVVATPPNLGLEAC